MIQQEKGLLQKRSKVVRLELILQSFVHPDWPYKQVTFMYCIFPVGGSNITSVIVTGPTIG